MHGASRHLLKPRVARLRLQQQQATSAQAKIDLALFAALMKMTASHKELIAHVTRTQVSYPPNEECPFPTGEPSTSTSYTLLGDCRTSTPRRLRRSQGRSARRVVLRISGPPASAGSPRQLEVAKDV